MASNTRNKGEKRAQERDKRPQAHVKHVRVSSRKAKQVIDLVRGKNVDEALAILQFTPKFSSPLSSSSLTARSRTLSTIRISIATRSTSLRSTPTRAPR